MAYSPGCARTNAAFKAILAGLPGLEFREITDPEGECATLLTVFLPTEEIARKIASALGTKVVTDSGWHVYSNMEQILEKRTITAEGCPFTCPYYKGGPVEYRKGMLPQTDDLLSRAINISIGVSDPGLGSAFGVTIHDTVDTIDACAELFQPDSQSVSINPLYGEKSMNGIEYRLKEVIHPQDGRSLIVDASSGLALGALPGLEDFEQGLHPALALVDGIVCSPGQFRRFSKLRRDEASLLGKGRLDQHPAWGGFCPASQPILTGCRSFPPKMHWTSARWRWWVLSSWAMKKRSKQAVCAPSLNGLSPARPLACL